MRKEATEGARRHPPLPSLVFVGRQLSYLTEEIGSSRFFFGVGEQGTANFSFETRITQNQAGKKKLALFYITML